jgi:hypothetical protein
LISDTPWERAGADYHVFCLHTVWDAQAVAEVMASEDTRYVTILRDPVDQFLSQWHYYHMEKAFGVSLEEFLTGPMEAIPERSRAFVVGRNQMLFDLGMSPEDFDSDERVRQKINELSASFDLVMLAERFEESMVLLRDLMCWDEEAVTYLKQNERGRSAREGISLEALLSLKSWLSADHALYDHFSAVFQRHAEAFGADRMRREVASLRAANDRVRAECIEKAAVSSELRGIFKPYGDSVGYQLKANASADCKYFAISELGFLAEMREMQARRFPQFEFEGAQSRTNRSISFGRFA